MAQFMPLLMIFILFLSYISLKSSSLIFCILTTGILALVFSYIGRQMKLPKSWVILIQWVVAVVIFSGFWLDFFALPAQAQFFKKAEDFFQNTLTQGSTTTDNTRTSISLVFNVVRAIYLLYIAGSLIGVINALRKDEDWQSIARTPLLVVISVTIADVLTSFIVGEPNK